MTELERLDKLIREHYLSEQGREKVVKLRTKWEQLPLARAADEIQAGMIRSGCSLDDAMRRLADVEIVWGGERWKRATKED